MALLLASVIVVTAEESALVRLDTLKKSFDWHVDDLSSPQKEFDSKYFAQLKELEASAISDGNLNLVLAVRAELAAFPGGKTPQAPSDQPELARLQTYYAGQVKRFAAEREEHLQKLVDNYRNQLTTLRDDLTRADQIASAVSVSEALGILDAAHPPAGPPPPVPPVAPALPISPSTDGFLAFRASVKGLLVVQLEGSKFAGTASDLSASAIPIGPAAPATVSFNQDVGDSMKTALGEVIKFHQVRYQGWPKGKRIEISFADKYSPKDGPSAAVACALLLESLITGKPLDGSFAVTGDMNADGSVQPIGGVSAKIRGATRRTCSIVAIPRENSRALHDLVLIAGVAPLLEIQVFSIGTFEEALALALAGRDPAVQAALDDFARVQELFSRPGADMRGLLAHPQVQAKLQGIVKAAPNHLSALLMLAAARGTMPKSLSLVGSLDAIEDASAVLLRIAQSGALDGKKFDALGSDELADAISGLRRNRALLDRRTWPYSDSIVDLGNLLRTWKDSRPKDYTAQRRLVEQIKAAADNVDRQFDALRTNEEIMEELIE